MKRWSRRALFWAGLILACSVLFLYGTLVSPVGTLKWHAVPTLLACMFPWTGLLLKSCKDGISESRTEDLHRNLYLLVWGVTALTVSCLFPVQQISVLLVSFPAFALLTGWNIDRMLREEGGRFAGWARVSMLMKPKKLLPENQRPKEGDFVNIPEGSPEEIPFNVN